MQEEASFIARTQAGKINLGMESLKKKVEH
jgi:hypothetical protein